MAEFDIFTEQLRGQMNRFEDIESTISSVERDLAGIGASSVFNGSFAVIITKVTELIVVLQKNKIKCEKLKDSLNQIIRLYEKTEAAISGEKTLLERLAERIGQAVNDIKGQLEAIKEYVRGKFNDWVCMIGDPVNSATGNFVDEIKEFTVDGDYPITISRFYNAFDYKRNGALGRGWRINHEMYLTKKSEDEIIFENYDGSTTPFAGENGIYCSVWGMTVTISSNDKGYILDTGKEQQYFDLDGKIIKKLASNGSFLKYTYEDVLTKIESSSGEFVEFFYNDDKSNLQKVVASNGKSVEYKYEDCCLTEVCKDNLTLKYEYEDGKLAQSTNSESIVVLRNEYDSQNRVVKQTFADEGTMYYSYTDDGTVFISQSGLKTIYRYDELLRNTEIEYPDGKICYTYNDRNQKTSVTDKLGNVTRYSYDDKGNVTKIIDALGGVKNYTYNANNQLVAYSSSTGRKLSLAYAPDGSLKELKNSNGDTVCEFTDEIVAQIKRMTGKTINNADSKQVGSVIETTAGGKILVEKLGTNNSKKYHYNSIGKVSKIEYSDGNCIEMEYDKSWNMISKKVVGGDVYAYEYDLYNQLVSVTKNGKVVNSYKYDEVGNKIAEINEKTGVTLFKYDELNRVVAIRNHFGNVRKFEYDQDGLVTYFKDFNGKVFEYERDEFGRKISESRNGSAKMYFDYDANNRIIRRYNTKGEGWNYEYDENGNVSKITDLEGNATKYLYDGKTCIQMEDAYGSTLHYDYEDGKLVSKTWTGLEQGHNVTKTISLGYDERGKMNEVTDAMGNKETYIYDSMQRLTRKIDAMNRVLEFEYSDGKRLDRIIKDGSSLSYIYDEKNRIVGYTDDNGTIRMNRDERGMIVSTVDYDGLETVYNRGEHGEIVSVVYPDQSVISYEYTEDMKLAKVCSGESVIAYEYDENNRIATRTLSGDIKEKYTYGDNDRVARYTVLKSDEIIMSNTYEYDFMGNKTSIVHEENGTTTVTKYEYDKLHRIQSVVENGIVLRSYEYDGFGNRSKLVAADHKVNYEYNANNQLVKETFTDVNDNVVKTQSYEYDLVGNMVGKTISADDTVSNVTYEYDALNHVVKCTSDGEVVDYKYNAFGRLIEKTSSKETVKYMLDLASDNLNIIGINKNGSNNKLIWTNKLEACVNDNVYNSVFTDEVGTVNYTYDAEGNQTMSAKYDEFGNRLSLAGEDFDFGFAGYLSDVDADMYYAAERFYDASVGRFNKVDTGMKDIMSVQNQNSYIYCFNRPLDLVDNDGCFPLPSWDDVCDWWDDTTEAAGDWIEDRYEDAVEVYNDVVDWGHDRVEDVVEWGHGAEEWVNNRIDDVVEWGHGAEQWVNNRIDDVIEWGHGAEQWVTEKIDFVQNEWNYIQDNGGIPGVFETMWDNLWNPEQHYGRNQANDDFVANLTWDQIIDEYGNPKGDWVAIPDSQAVCHMKTDGAQGADAENNHKYVLIDPETGTSYEVILCYETDENGRIILDATPQNPNEPSFPYIVDSKYPENMGTYNYVDLNNSYIGHGIFDLLPYYIWGNTPDDPNSLLGWLKGNGWVDQDAFMSCTGN